MRFSLVLKASLFGAAVALAAPLTAAAEDGPSWQGCVGSQSSPVDRVSACSAVIDGKAETGRGWPPPIATVVTA